MLNCVKCENLRKMIGESGRKTVLDHYSKDTVKEKYYKLYNSLIEKHEKNGTTPKTH